MRIAQRTGTATLATFPATLLWRFRVASLEIQAVMWTTLGLLFGWLVERDVSFQNK